LNVLILGTELELTFQVAIAITRGSQVLLGTPVSALAYRTRHEENHQYSERGCDAEPSEPVTEPGEGVIPGPNGTSATTIAGSSAKVEFDIRVRPNASCGHKSGLGRSGHRKVVLDAAHQGHAFMYHGIRLFPVPRGDQHQGYVPRAVGPDEPWVVKILADRDAGLAPRSVNHVNAVTGLVPIFEATDKVVFVIFAD
jgi:hypothetical protein